MSDFPETSYSLIARVQALADSACWEEFVRIYQPVVMRLARNRGLQEADSLDVMQQVLLSISKSINGWSVNTGQPPFRAWLTTITRNAITKSLARRPLDCASGSSSVMELMRQVPDAGAGSAEVLIEARKELFRYVAEQIRPEFSEETWNIFWRTSVDGESVSEVQASTGRTRGAIYVARYRVISRLKDMVQKMSLHWDLLEESRP